MSNEIAIPAHMQALIAQNQQTSESLITSAGGSVPRISLKGRQFRFIKDGEEVAKVPGPINVVVLGVQPEKGMAKTFYLNGYQPGDNSPPDCSSSDGIRPDSWISSPVNPTCHDCPNNKWGSTKSMTGKKAKSCKDSKRLFITKASDPVKGVPYILNVTVSSLRSLSDYGKKLVSNKIPLSSVITTITMADSDFPQVEFDFKDFLSEELVVPTLERSQKREWDEFDASAVASSGDSNESTVDASKPNNPIANNDEKVKASTGDILDNWG